MHVTFGHLFLSEIQQEKVGRTGLHSSEIDWDAETCLFKKQSKHYDERLRKLVFLPTNSSLYVCLKENGSNLDVQINLKSFKNDFACTNK